MIRSFCRQRRAVLVATLAFLVGCKSKQPVKVQQAAEEGPRIASMVHTGDPKSQDQLLNGFYGIEQNSWRWTGRKFSVALRPPPGSSQKGAVLNVQLAIPDPVINQLKAVSLSGNVGTAPLSPESYTQTGQYTYTRDVPPSALTGESVRIDFQLDKSIPPGDVDKRELGIIVNSVSLDAK
jgi:hypothetical protein